MKQAITFVNNRQTSIVTSLEELIKEINHYQCFWLDSLGKWYSNTNKTVSIMVKDLTYDDRKWLSMRMR